MTEGIWIIFFSKLIPTDEDLLSKNLMIYSNLHNFLFLIQVFVVNQRAWLCIWNWFLMITNYFSMYFYILLFILSNFPLIIPSFSTY